MRRQRTPETPVCYAIHLLPSLATPSLRRARERRQQQEALAATKTLGEGGDETDDVMAWVGKSRTLEQKRAEEARRKAEEAKKKSQAAEEESDDEEAGLGAGGTTAADLAGAKVRHTAEELAEGETMILTLEVGAGHWVLGAGL